MTNKKKASTSYLDIAIPENIENMQLPSPELLTFYKNFEDRILWIDNEINDYSIEYAKYIMQWNRDDKLAGIKKEDRKPIKLLFFSPGGDLNVNNMLVDTIALSETKVIGINCGMAASAACFIYLSCHERLTLPNAQFQFIKELDHLRVHMILLFQQLQIIKKKLKILVNSYYQEQIYLKMYFTKISLLIGTLMQMKQLNMDYVVKLLQV